MESVRREKCDAASELAANTFVIFAGKRRLIAAKLHSFVTQMWRRLLKPPKKLESGRCGSKKAKEEMVKAENKFFLIVKKSSRGREGALRLVVG